MYYINWEDGTRTTVDPRTTSAFSPTPHSTSSASRRTRRASTPSSGYTSMSSVGVDVTDAWRGAVAGNDSGYDNDDEEEEDDEEDADEEEEEEEEGEEDDEAESSSTESSSSSSTGSSRGSAVSSTLSSFSPTDESGSGDNGGGLGAGHVLVAAGCRACFMYFMVPKRAVVCPKCGSSGLLHLSSNGYA